MVEFMKLFIEMLMAEKTIRYVKQVVPKVLIVISCYKHFSLFYWRTKTTKQYKQKSNFDI